MSDETETSLTPSASALTEWDPAEFSSALAKESAKRAALEDYIKSHLREGVDYGTIPFGPDRQSKPTIFKPGAEKIASLLHLRPFFKADADTLKMLGEVGTGTLAYICTLMTPSGEVVAEGRGSAGTEKADANTRIKIAQKRAMVDAVLRVAALSDHFTQDLDDMDVPAPRAAAPAQRAPMVQPTGIGPAPRHAPQRPPEPGHSHTPIKVGISIGFGKHKGEDIGAIETSYLEWLAGKPLEENDERFGDKNRQINAAVRQVLALRKGKAPAPRKAQLPDERTVEGDINEKNVNESMEEREGDILNCPDHGPAENCPQECPNSFPF